LLNERFLRVQSNIFTHFDLHAKSVYTIFVYMASDAASA